MKLKIEENTYYIYLYYDIQCNTKETALEKFVGYTYNPNFTSKSIRIDDGNSFHDGTYTQVFSQIDDVDRFIQKCCTLPIRNVSLSAEYKEMPFAVLLSLETLQVRLSCIKDYMVNYYDLERQLDLL